MYPYIIVFIISTLILYITRFIKNKVLKNIFIVVALIIPCILAGLRDISVGTDTIHYKKIFDEISLHNIKYLFHNLYTIELGYKLFIYFFIHITYDYNIFLFIEEILIIFILYFSLKKYKCLENSLWFAMFTFYCLLYNQTLNITRQYLSLVICFYGISCFINNKNKKNFIIFVITEIISYNIHRSSLFGIIILLFHYLLNTNKKIIISGTKKINLRKYSLALIFGICLFMLLNINSISKLLLISDSLSRYTRYVKNGIVTFTYFNIKIIPFIIIFYLAGSNPQKKDVNINLYVLLFCIRYFLITPLSYGNYYTGRIGLLFELFNIILIPILRDSFNKKENKILFNIVIFILLILIWWLNNVYLGYAETIPYLLYK